MLGVNYFRWIESDCLIGTLEPNFETLKYIINTLRFIAMWYYSITSKLKIINNMINQPNSNQYGVNISSAKFPKHNK